MTIEQIFTSIRQQLEAMRRAATGHHEPGESSDDLAASQFRIGVMTARASHVETLVGMLSDRVATLEQNLADAESELSTLGGIS